MGIFGCSSLTSIDLSSFDFSSVTTTGNMFNSCTNLKNISLPSKMNSLQTADSMFYDCSSLKYINLSFMGGVSDLKSVYGMFRNCVNLIEIEFPNVYSDLIEDISKMFYECKNIKRINLSKFEGKSNRDMSQMFYHCINLEFIDISNLNLANVENSIDIFEGVGQNITKTLIIEYNADKIDENIKSQIDNVTWKTSL